MYNPDRSLMAWISEFEFREATPRQVFQAVLDRFPDKLAGIDLPVDYDPKEQFRTCLYSKEFQKNVMWLVPRAYPEIQRLIFVHIPKCAGTDLGLALRSRYPAIKDALCSTDLTAKRDLFATLRDLSIRLRFAERILLYGHIPLSDFLSKRMVRAQDAVFSVLRKPSEMFLSKVNYVITRIRDDVEKGELKPDSRAWMSQLGIDEKKHDPTEEFLKNAYKDILRKASLGRNMMCRMLGAGTFASSLEHIAMYDIEIADTGSYDRWLMDRWELTSSRSNKSVRYISADDLDTEDRKFIAEMSTEDERLFDFVRNELDKTGKSSIRGRDLTLAKIDAARQANTQA
jgi:hypothetical protein